MGEYRDERHPGRGESRGCGDRRYEEPDRGGREREQERPFGGFGRGSPRDRMGSEQFRSDDFDDCGERDYRDFGRGQPGGVYEHAGNRDYRHGSGYGGFGESPGESGGGFDSGRSYAAEPGWGPGYGDHSGGHDDGGPGRHGEPRRHGRAPKGYQRSDERMKEDICARLTAAAVIDASDVSVEVQDGKATLEGSVPEGHMKHRIEDIAADYMDAKGIAEGIDSRIRVAPVLSESQSQTALDIEGAGNGTGFGAGQQPPGIRFNGGK